MRHAGNAEIYEKHAAELVRFATSITGPSAAADVVADAVVRAMTSPTWRGVVNHRAYLYRAVLNEARMHHRSAMARRARELRAPVSAGDDEPVLRPEVAEALATLDERQRAVVFLTYWEDLDAGRVARFLDISIRTVRRDLATAKGRLRGLLHD